ncbi:octopine/nopaline transport system permease protein [Rhizobium sp. RU33A]|uniref:ABC transporter permease n=1 Tax=Rhizobium sp. RU33A TaxID=1907413 RepID=UPI000956011B|nr:ABC transporter permease subunit [Rhizobium sp. RU33A]SIQ85462.1 octopine/nopaline transport system permease protein [Rhizobium sp. RU33A]
MFEKLYLLGFSEGGWAAALLGAAGVTLVLSLLGFVLGAVFGALGAAGALSAKRIPRALASAYGTVFRGVPDLLTIYLFYYGGSVALTAIARSFGSDGFVGLPSFATGILAMGIISGAYQAEVYRGAYLAVEPGQFDAAKALALTRMQMLRFVVVPQLLRHAVPGLSNVWQLVLKDSALISVIGLVELMRQAQVAAGSTREPFLFYVTAAGLYFVIAAITGQAFRVAEDRASRGLAR